MSPAQATPVRYGGVSSVPHRPAIQGVETVREAGGPVPAAAAFPNFTWQGGPVVHCAQIYPSFWGDAWLTDPTHLQRAGRLSQFLKDLVSSQFMNVLSQYGAGFGAGAGMFVQASFLKGITGNITDASIQSTIQSCINAGALPEPANPSNTCIIIYLAEGIGVGNPGDQIVMCEANNDTAFGYHSFFVTSAGHHCYYAVIPGLDDACLQNSCGSDSNCSLHLAETQEQRQTQVTSHEFAEMITDPELNAWYDGLNGENGDICNGQADVLTVGPNSWTVQRTYSKADDVSSNGATICRSTAPSAIPALTPGPSGLTVATARQAMKPGSFDRLLPLPQVEFDVSSLEKRYDATEIRMYAERMFAPMQHDTVVPDLPALLAHVSEMLRGK